MQPPAICNVVSSAFLLLLLLGGAQWVQAENPKAEALNDEGRKLLIQQIDLEAAAQKFREALALDDDPRYAFNLCYTLEKSGKLQSAQKACNRVLQAGNSRLIAKAQTVLAKIAEKLPAAPANGQAEEQAKLPSPAPVAVRPPVHRPLPGSIAPPIAPPIKTSMTGSRTQIGVSGGLSLAYFSGEQSDWFSSIGGYALGVGAKLPAGSLRLVSRVQRVARGADFFETNASLREHSGDLTLTYLDVGTSLQVPFHGGLGGIQFYGSAGAVLSFLWNGDVGERTQNDTTFCDGIFGDCEVLVIDSIADFDFGLEFGLGAITRSGWDFELRYIHGLIDVTSIGAGTTIHVELLNRIWLLDMTYWL